MKPGSVRKGWITKTCECGKRFKCSPKARAQYCPPCRDKYKGIPKFEVRLDEGPDSDAVIRSQTMMLRMAWNRCANDSREEELRVRELVESVRGTTEDWDE